MILNQKVPVVKMIPLIYKLPRGEGLGERSAMVTPSPMDLKSDCIKGIACPISISCK